MNTNEGNRCYRINETRIDVAMRTFQKLCAKITWSIRSRFRGGILLLKNDENTNE